MAEEIRMPALGQTTDEMRIITWLKNEGDAVKLGERLLEVETDKATLEVESAVGGTLLKILYNADDNVQAGAVIAYVGKAGEVLPDKQAPTGTSQPIVREAASESIKATPLARRMAQENGIELKAVQANGGKIEKRDIVAALDKRTVKAGKVLARPTARLLAMQHGIDIQQVRGTGVDGLIEKSDVQALIDAPVAEPISVPTSNPTPSLDGNIEIPVPQHRLVIAQRLTKSVQTIPQIRLTATADMTQARTLINTQRAAGLTQLTYTHLLLRAVALALREHPKVNRLWLDGNPPRYLQLAQANVGIAIASDDNLLVATIPESDHMGLTALVRLVSAAVERGRSGKLSQSDLAQASITISNLGMYGIDDFQAIVDPSQTAILAVGRVAEEVIVTDGLIRVVPQMKLTLSIDHRVVDGAAAAQFLSAIRQHIEQAEI